ncbi:hypothetical protein NQ315_011389 [Exocentrus adspersus]|uniref:Uncharacterized protein n=1 Tax=Exocentrus adspersus TaxID=1586481 RepID=A0AAV8VJP8_9CUCU|nr:hypothetical protein NQ315_011389 [Exocentrus adspersus]
MNDTKISKKNVVLNQYIQHPVSFKGTKGQAVLDEIFKIRYCDTPQSPHPYSKSWGCAPSQRFIEKVKLILIKTKLRLELRKNQERTKTKIRHLKENTPQRGKHANHISGLWGNKNGFEIIESIEMNLSLFTSILGIRMIN